MGLTYKSSWSHKFCSMACFVHKEYFGKTSLLTPGYKRHFLKILIATNFLQLLTI